MRSGLRIAGYAGRIAIAGMRAKHGFAPTQVTHVCIGKKHRRRAAYSLFSAQARGLALLD